MTEKVPDHVVRRVVIDEVDNGFVVYRQFRGFGDGEVPEAGVAISMGEVEDAARRFDTGCGRKDIREQLLTRALLLQVLEQTERWGSKHVPRIHVGIRDTEGNDIALD